MCMHVKHGKNASMRKLILHIKTLNFFFKISYAVNQRARHFIVTKMQRIKRQMTNYRI